ncbi:hypothetical protein GALL_501270 [mine drainage metagenome]|uniref:Uncharacterized protein n=1 Tax=mine drainage metagenome TaxID=410659 RepID=A0A1J5PSL4_9ZZZZ
MTLQRAAIAVHHLLDEERLRRLEAVVADGAVGPHHLAQGHIGRPQGQAGIGRQGALDPALPGEINDVQDAGVIEGADGRHVAGIANGFPDGDGTPEIHLIVVGFVGFHPRPKGLVVLRPVGVGDGDVVAGVEEPRGHIVHDRRGRLARSEGGTVHEGLHGGAHLPLGLEGAVVLRLVEVVAAHHGPDLARLRVNGHEGALHHRFLIQFEGLRGAVLRGLHQEEGRGPAGQQLLDVLPGPGEG